MRQCCSNVDASANYRTDLFFFLSFVYKLHMSNSSTDSVLTEKHCWRKMHCLRKMHVHVQKGYLLTRVCLAVLVDRCLTTSGFVWWFQQWLS